MISSSILLAVLAVPQDADPTSISGARSAAAPQSAAPVVAALTGNPIHVLFSSIATSTTSDVPGVPGAKFTGTAAFDRPWSSPNGAHWVLRADTDLATTEDQVILVDGIVAEREGTPTPFTAGTYGVFDVRIGVNDSGEYAFFNNLSSTTVNDDYVIRVSPGPVYSIVAQEGMAIPALPASTYDDTLDSIVLLNNGDVALDADLIDGGGVTTNDDEILVLGSTLVAREGITIPAGQAGGATNAWENFDFEDKWFDNAGNVLIKGDVLVTPTTDDGVVVYNGNVVLQENQIIPGSGFANPIDGAGIVEVGMDHAGNWFARGNNDATEQDWVVRNGTVIASEGSSVLASPGRYRVLAGTLDGAQETPPSGSAGTGTATVTVDTLLNTLTYTITFTGLGSAETDAHIHGFAPPGTPAGVLFALPLGTPKNGVLTYAEADEASILAGLTYVNVHTVGFPSGEIRGQLVEVPEVWDDRDFSDTFFLHVGDTQGNWILGGTTNGNSTRNGVLVLNGTTEIAREGDPIDVDGNGLFDDDAFFNTFGNDDAFLRDDGTVVFVATIRNAAGTQAGQGVFERSLTKSLVPFCFGDGVDTSHTTQCPCANFGAAGNGCANSVNANGAHLDATGTPANDDVVLVGSGMPATVSCIYLQGTALDDATFGDGVRCTGGTLLRLRTRANVGGTSSFPDSTDTITLSQRGGVVPGSGDVRYYQTYYRNSAAGFCPPETFNVTNGMRAIW